MGELEVVVCHIFLFYYIPVDLINRLWVLNLSSMYGYPLTNSLQVHADSHSHESPHGHACTFITAHTSKKAKPMFEFSGCCGWHWIRSPCSFLY